MRRFNVISLIVFWAILLLTEGAFAQTASIQASVSNTQIGLEDQLSLEITLNGSSLLSEPEIPSKGNFRVVGRNTRLGMNWINGRMQTTKTYEYILEPIQVGTFRIGPFSALIDGQRQSASPITIVVTQDSPVAKAPKQVPLNRPQMNPTPNFPNFPTLPRPNFPQGNQNQDLSRLLYLDETVSKPDPYVGEPVLYTLRLFAGVPVLAGNLNPIDFGDLIAERAGQDKKYEQNINGVRFAVHEIQYILTATSAGDFNIPAPTADLQIRQMRNLFDDPFFNTMSSFSQHKLLKGKKQVLSVKALPASPSNFIGVVGQFSLDADLDKQNIDMGETATLTLKLKGKGNLRDASIPKLPKIHGVRVYEDKAKLNTNKTLSGLSGEKVFKYALVGQIPGTHPIPPIKFSYFDPLKGSYEELNTDAYTVVVKGNALDEKFVSAGIDPESEHEDENQKSVTGIRGIVAKGQLLAERKNELALIGYLPIYLIPVSWIFLAFFLRYRRSTAGDRMKSVAFKELKSSLKNSETAGEIVKNAKSYLGAKFDKVGGAMTPFEIRQILDQKKVDAKLSQELIGFIEELEFASYGGGESKDVKLFKRDLLNKVKALDKLI